MGIRELAFDRTIAFGPRVRGGMVGQGNIPLDWANTAAAIAYQYQFDGNSGEIFSKEKMETYGHTRNERDMDELRKIFLSCLFTRLRTKQYTIDQARVLCKVFYDVVEVMFLESLWKDIKRVLNMRGVSREPWQRFGAEVVSLLQQGKGEVRGRIVNYHNTLGFSENTLCYASFSHSQIQGIRLTMGSHGYAGSIYFPNGRIRLIHVHGPEISEHRNVVRTVGNKRNYQENIIIELQDNAAELQGKTAQIQDPCIYEYEQADLNHHVQGSEGTVGRCIGIRIPQTSHPGWQSLDLARRCHFHKSRGIPRKVTLNNQQIEALFFIGENIKQMRRNVAVGGIAEAGNRFVLEYLDMHRAAKQSLGYSP